MHPTEKAICDLAELIARKNRQVTDQQAEIKPLREEQQEIARILQCPDADTGISTPSNLPNLIRDRVFEIQQLRRALAPFAEAAKHMTIGKRSNPREAGIWTAPDGSCRVSVADFRRAAEAKEK